MSWARGARFVIGAAYVALVLLGACTLTEGSVLDELENRDCESGYKVCVDPSDRLEKCVPFSDPSYSCGQATCAPCSLRNARARCRDGFCVWAACNSGYKSCDGDDRNGCETDIHFDEDNCGDCGTPCTVENGLPACVAGVCRVSRCNEGFYDCNLRGSDGCECSTRCDGRKCGSS